MTGRVLILGSTDITHVVARCMLECSHDIAAIVGVGDQFDLSYADILGAPGQIALVAECAHSLILTGDVPLETLAATDEAGNDMLPVLAKHSNQRLTRQ